MSAIGRILRLEYLVRVVIAAFHREPMIEQIRIVVIRLMTSLLLVPRNLAA